MCDYDIVITKLSMISDSSSSSLERQIDSNRERNKDIFRKTI